jgi:hypothetical protein
MPLAYTVAIFRSSFNWGEIISKQLSTCILQAQSPKEGEAPAFHMASYLLDVSSQIRKEVEYWVSMA